jgi:toxin ParE1/3/4
MKHKVELSRRAQRDVESNYLYIRRDAPQRAAQWRLRLLDAIDSLERFPERHALAPEAEVAGLDVRQMLFGMYRVLYVVEGDTVNVLTVRHGARQFLQPDELTGEH